MFRSWNEARVDLGPSPYSFGVRIRTRSVWSLVARSKRVDLGLPRRPLVDGCLRREAAVRRSSYKRGYPNIRRSLPASSRPSTELHPPPPGGSAPTVPFDLTTCRPHHFLPLPPHRSGLPSKAFSGHFCCVTPCLTPRAGAGSTLGADLPPRGRLAVSGNAFGAYDWGAGSGAPDL